MELFYKISKKQIQCLIGFFWQLEIFIKETSLGNTQSKYAHTIYLNENSIFFNVLYPLPRPESIIIQLKSFCPVISFTCYFNDNKSLPLTQYQHAFVRNKYSFFPSKICYTKYNLLRSKLLQTEWNISNPFYLFKKK